MVKTCNGEDCPSLLSFAMEIQLLKFIKNDQDESVLDLLKDSQGIHYLWFLEFTQLKSCALIRLGRFEEALKILDKSDNRIMQAYCLLKMNKAQEALSIIGSENLSNDEKLLKAQVMFRLEAYSDCLDLYRHYKLCIVYQYYFLFSQSFFNPRLGL